MKKLTLLAMVAVFVAPAMAAQTFYHTLTPDMVSGTVYGTNDAAPGFGSGSWQANGSNKFTLSLTPEALFGYSVDVKDIAGISWYTNKGEVSNYDWYLTVRTKPTSYKWGFIPVGAESFTLEPLYANNRNNPANQWVQWSTDEGTNQLTIYDRDKGTVQGFYGGPTLDDITSGTVNWGDYPTSGSNQSFDYSQLTVSKFEWETATYWAGSYTGLLDGIRIELTNGDVAIINLEATLTATPIPAPGAILLAGIGTSLVGWLRRRRTI